MHIDNKWKNTLILKLTTKALYPTNFTQQNKVFVYVYTIMEETAFYLLMLQK